MTTRVNQFGQTIGAPLSWAALQKPEPQVLQGSSARLERLTSGHVPSLFAEICAPGTESAWTYMSQGPFTDEAQLADYVAPMIASESWSPFAIVGQSTGQALGMACYLRIDPAMGAVEVGAVMLGPRLARTRGATEAMTLMARHVFDDLGYRRYEWKCDALNTPSRGAAQRLGFSYEGTWRKAMVYKGRSRDTAWFAMTDDDWAGLRPLHDSWLATTTDEGQESSLSALTAPLLHPKDLS